MIVRSMVYVLGFATLGISLVGGCSSSHNGASPAGSGSPTILQGTWATSCTTGSGGPFSSQITTYVFSGSSFTMKQTNFSDTACATLAATLASSGTFTIGAAATGVTNAPSGATVDALTFTQSTLTATPASASIATELNTANNGSSICANGTTAITFSTGTTSIAGATCGGNNSSALLADGASFVDVFALNGTSLYFGQSGTLNAPANATQTGGSGYTWTSLEQTSSAALDGGSSLNAYTKQ